jgi:glutamate synthase domain-containing protein 2/glutamate synthase domain-containing protein 1/glutamate synthase domain-containing protein 3
MKDVFGFDRQEKSACGVGFTVNRNVEYNHSIVQKGLQALRCVEHRGACSSDKLSSDGAGIMTDIPFELLGYERGTVAVAMLFVPTNQELQRKLLQTFEDTFAFWEMNILAYREVPIDPSVLGKQALKSMPCIIQAIIQRPYFCNTDSSFNKRLYTAIRMTLTKQRKYSPVQQFFLASLSVNTIVYKALTKADTLDKFYLDLQNPAFKSRFSMIHRRFSTNTVTSWDKAQPFRLIGHNGEINTIDANRSWSYSREKCLGLPRNELITHEGISDSGTVNEMMEALMYRSSLPHIEDALALMVPPADQHNAFYKFWSRAMEPWDGPALITFSDGKYLGARLDRNGFRPCRWTLTEDHFYLASEAGAFDIEGETVLSKGSLRAGSGVKIDLKSGEIDFKDPSKSKANYNVNFDSRLFKLGYRRPENENYDFPSGNLNKKYLFNYTEEEVNKIILPMIRDGKEPIGSMGDTARLAILSNQSRSFFDFFFQNFAQVTNPPLDYLREKIVTDLSVYLGPRPNIFSKKELIPPPAALELKSPVLSLGQMEYIKALNEGTKSDSIILSKTVNITFKKQYGAVSFRSSLENIAREVIAAVKKGASIIILSDREADWENLPIPVLIILRSLIIALDKEGLRFKASLVIDSAQIYTTHHLATTISCGASAVCPYLALQMARYESEKNLDKTEADNKEINIIKAMEAGLLKVMSKMGISVVRSYQSSRLFTIIGLDKDFCKLYFRSIPSLVGGLGIDEIVSDIIERSQTGYEAANVQKLIHTYQFREFQKGTVGEKHSMTSPRSKIIHQLVRSTNLTLQSMELYEEYLKSFEADDPVNIRHLLDLKPAAVSLDLAEVQPVEEILKEFGSGAMSFGAISAESQRDIILAMQEIGGRSNSGEGGENPYYYTEGISTTIKQVASARFGVTAKYLISANEFQIKIAQGAKPGEGGQLMAAKVNVDIARARHSLTNVDLISPPPLHDIYSIEDLKQLIYELKQIKPEATVNVKLVSGANIGTIAVGVAKAGADIIHISGSDGGTGAASLSSMKHAGLPFEFGLVEVHKALIDNDLRCNVILRSDGGIHTGKDVVMAAIMGSDQFDFGKLLLVAQGCIMARVCEKNTCPAGIATHDQKFKGKYKGTKDQIVQMLRYIAEDVRRYLALTGMRSLKEIKGRTEFLQLNQKHLTLINKRKIDMGFILGQNLSYSEEYVEPVTEALSSLNKRVADDCSAAIENNKDINLNYNISTADRAALANLCGIIAKKEHLYHLDTINNQSETVNYPFSANINITFNGSAGQGFCVFMVNGINVRLCGEANDSVCKTMSGGKVVIVPPLNSGFKAEENVIIGNCALYGATGGKLYVRGLAGDRFAVRNSGAVTVVEGTGLHACEYMTNGKVIILGQVEQNLGSGMTGGRVYLYGEQDDKINHDYVVPLLLHEADYQELKEILEDYQLETSSEVARDLLADWENSKTRFKKCLPVNVAKLEEIATVGV